MNAAKRPLVLIVDDVLGNIEVLAASLSESYDVSFACSGAEGIAVAGNYPPDLILLDIMMPGMDGFEACRRMRANESLHDVPIIFISALEEVGHKIHAFQSGGNDYVTKPFQSEEVLARVSTHIALYRARRELHERGENLRVNLAELEIAHRRLREMSCQLAQAEKQAAIGQLAGGVAHEINTPLGYVKSNLSALKGYVAELLNLVAAYGEVENLLPMAAGEALAARRKSIDLAFLQKDVPTLIDESSTGVERVRVIVRNLLTLSSRLDEIVETVDLHQVMDEALSTVWAELNPSVEVFKEYGELPLVECMPIQIGQAFVSLLRNAFQSMPNGGHLTLRGKSIDNGVAIDICDTGCGILPENQGRIFDPFFTTQPVGKGTGLGLSVAYGIIVRHGGSINVTSEPGKGSVFTVWLPVRNPAPCCEPPP